MLVQRGFGEIALELTDEQYRKLCNRRFAEPYRTA